MSEPKNEEATVETVADSAPPAEATPEIAPPTAEEFAEMKDRLLRTLAEMENLRTRTQRDLDEGRKYAVTSFARDLLDVADNLRRALASVPAEVKSQAGPMGNLVTGVEMTERSLLNAFEKHQVRKVSPQPGEKFDHKVHQAMFEVPTAAQPAGAVAEVMQDGYVIGDRLLRPALVGVAKAPAGEAPPAARGSKVDTNA
ncbi:MAG: nucleotide exchange factor GrpE [Geminicoccaceae bacterium]